MAQEMPVPPEADVIRLARLSARMSVDEAVAAVRAAGGQVSATYWRDIERGHGGRRGRRVTARASEGLLAQMAAAVGADPARLAEAGRGDAARVMVEILRREHPPGPVSPSRPAPSGTRFAATPAMQQAMAPHLGRLRARLGEVRAAPEIGADGTPTGEQMFAAAPRFGDARDRADLAAFWDTFTPRGLPAEEIAELTAAFMAHRAERRARGQGTATGLIPAHGP